MRIGSCSTSVAKRHGRNLWHLQLQDRDRFVIREVRRALLYMNEEEANAKAGRFVCFRRILDTLMVRSPAGCLGPQGSQDTI